MRGLVPVFRIAPLLQVKLLVARTRKPHLLSPDSCLLTSVSFYPCPNRISQPMPNRATIKQTKV